MSKAAKINEDGTVISVHNYRPVTDDNGIQHPRNIFTLWTDEELNAIGYARFDEENVPSDKRSTGTTDTFADGRVFRSHTTKDFVPGPPPPDKQPDEEGYDYVYERSKVYPTTDDLIVAMWEQVVEDRPDTATALEVDRQAVKVRFPK
jgi:hypothetical protein